MENAVTRGQRSALAAVRTMVAGHAPHAVLLVGPASSGKKTLALDLAAGLLCLDPDPAARPCRTCRGCRQIASGNHPDLHFLAPEGPGGQIRIGKATDPEQGTVRHLVSELALLSVEGGARVAIVEAAHRMNEDAQNALLKTLEEPPGGVTLVLCADDDERLLPTVRSRCVRIRLGTVSIREIEEWLAQRATVDAPNAAKAARLSGGRPGLALAYALSPDAGRLHAELARGILDLVRVDRQIRLTTVRDMLRSAAALNVALGEGRLRANETDAAGLDSEAAGEPPKRRRRTAASDTPKEPSGPTAADRRAAAATLLEIWSATARDLAVVSRGARREIADPDLLEDLVAAADGLEATALTSFLARLTELARQLDENVNPELALDVVALCWPRPAQMPAVYARPRPVEAPRA